MNINVAGQNAKWCSCSVTREVRVPREPAAVSPGTFSRQLKITSSHHSSYRNVQSSNIYSGKNNNNINKQTNKQKRNPKPQSVDERPNKLRQAPPHDGAPFSPPNRRSADGAQPRERQAKCKKPVTKGHLVYDSPHVKCPSEANPQRERSAVVRQGEGVEMASEGW